MCENMPNKKGSCPLFYKARLMCARWVRLRLFVLSCALKQTFMPGQTHRMGQDMSCGNRSAAAGPGERVRIVVADLTGYPLYREKYICGKIVKCGIGRIFDNMLRFRAGLNFDVTLVINSRDSDDRPGPVAGHRPEETPRHAYESLKDRYPFVREVMFRDNVGQDIGAYNAGYTRLKNEGHDADVVFMNSSVEGPSYDYWLYRYSRLYHRTGRIGLCGISINAGTSHREDVEFSPHVQSFFIYTDMKTLSALASDGNLPGSDLQCCDRNELVTKGEIELSRRALDKGYGICSSLFERFVYHKGDMWAAPPGDPRYIYEYNRFSNEI